MRAGRVAWKELFSWSGVLTFEQVLERLKHLSHFHGKDGIKAPIDFKKLEDFSEANESKCNNDAYLKDLQRLAEQSDRDFPALRSYLRECLTKQLALCNHEEDFKDRVEKFKQAEAYSWQLIQYFNMAVGEHGLREHDWKGELIDNQIQMNQALTSMFQEMSRRGIVGEHERSIKSYNVARSLKAACKSFEEKVGGALLRTTLHPDIEKNPELVEWLRYLNVCGQVQRVNFEPAVGDELLNQSLPGFVEWHDKWREWMGEY